MRLTVLFLLVHAHVFDVIKERFRLQKEARKKTKYAWLRE
jgi:hypothetical protein